MCGKKGKGRPFSALCQPLGEAVSNAAPVVASGSQPGGGGGLPAAGWQRLLVAVVVTARVVEGEKKIVVVFYGGDGIKKQGDFLWLTKSRISIPREKGVTKWQKGQ